MSEQTVRPIIKSRHVKAVKELVSYPQSADFDESLEELLKRFRQFNELKTKKSDS